MLLWNDEEPLGAEAQHLTHIGFGEIENPIINCKPYSDCTDPYSGVSENPTTVEGGYLHKKSGGCTPRGFWFVVDLISLNSQRLRPDKPY